MQSQDLVQESLLVRAELKQTHKKRNTKLIQNDGFLGEKGKSSEREEEEEKKRKKKKRGKGTRRQDARQRWHLK
jgi:hypothetical protein